MFIIGKPNINKAFYGDKDYFRRYQGSMLFLLNNPIGKIREKTREFFNISQNGKIVKLTPNALHIQLDKEYYRATCYSGNVYEWAMKRNFEGLQRLLHGFHNFDMKFANRFVPALNLGFDTLTSYCLTKAGRIRNKNANWNTCRNATSGDALYQGATTVITFYSSLESGNYYICRQFLYFDTSSLGEFANISTATLSIFGQADYGAQTSIMKGTQASTLTFDDFDSFTGSEYVHLDSWLVEAYNEFVLNAQGIADINKIGETLYCGRNYEFDYSNVRPGSAVIHRLGMYCTENDGTDKDPKLVIEYTAGGAEANSGFFMFM